MLQPRSDFVEAGGNYAAVCRRFFLGAFIGQRQASSRHLGVAQGWSPSSYAYAVEQL